MNPIRIKTFVGTVKVYTMYLVNNWATIVSDEPDLIISNTFFDACENHLRTCAKIKTDISLE